MTNLESIILSSSGGSRRSSESELFTTNIFCYDPKTQASYSATMKAKRNARKKAKQAGAELCQAQVQLG